LISINERSTSARGRGIPVARSLAATHGPRNRKMQQAA
jgi:hypothetical protein